MIEEQVALVDEADGRVTGSAPRSEVRRRNLPHAVVAVLVRDRAGRVYVHRRTDTKDVFPGMHDAFTAGCVLAGEPPEAAAVRELAEELGIDGVALTPLLTDWYADDATRHLAYVFTTTYDGPVTHQDSEIAWGGWLTLDELRAHLADPGWPMVPDGRALLDRLLAQRVLR